MTTKTRTYFHWGSAIALIVWTATLVCSAGWNARSERLKTLALAKNEAVANFNKDQAFRLWGTKHGGVYVPPTEHTPPNPYLSHIPDRDLTLPSGKQLTLMNPAYMVRELMTDFHALYGIEGRITSLKPLNPANAPDAWEREALAAFEQGASEVFNISGDGEEQQLRLMRPMPATAGCLKCHGHQGYKEGDIRGGVGVIVPMQPYLALESKAVRAIWLSHLGIWLFGLLPLALLFLRGRHFILEWERTNDSLLASKEYFQAIFDSVNDGLFVHDPETGAILDVNQMTCEMFGLTRPAVLRATVEDLSSGVAPYSGREAGEWLRKAAKSGPQRFEWQAKDSSGRVFWVEVNMRCVALGTADRIVVSVRDITERKRTEAELEQHRHHLEEQVASQTEDLRRSKSSLLNLVEDLDSANERLKEVDRLKSMFIASMSHELRTPLNSVIGFSSILLNEWTGPLNDEQKQNIASVLRSGKHLLALINDVIDISKVEAGIIETFIDDFDLVELLTEVEQLFAKEALDRKLSLEIPKPTLRMHTDRRRLLQCLLNLISNALKFTKQGGVTLAIQQGEVQGQVTIAVTDTGIGIAMEDQVKLFQSFSRIPSELSAKAPGTGLGLYLTKKIVVEILHGSIFVSSKPGSGSTFSITIPVRVETSP